MLAVAILVLCFAGKTLHTRCVWKRHQAATSGRSVANRYFHPT